MMPVPTLTHYKVPSPTKWHNGSFQSNSFITYSNYWKLCFSNSLTLLDNAIVSRTTLRGSQALHNASMHQ